MATRTAFGPTLVERVSESQDSNVGSAQKSSSNGDSAAQLLATLLPVALFALIWFILFLVFRPRFKRNYEPRTFLGSLRANERSPKLSDSMFGWIGEFYRVPDTDVLNHHSLDGYLFLRFLKISVVSCVVGCLITWPVLFPVNATGGGGSTQLDILNMSNVANNYYRYFAHAGCAIIFFSFIIFTITRESIFYINLRQAYLLSPYYASRLSSRTVLFTSVPEEYMNEAKLRMMLGPQARRVWFATHTKELEDKVKQRDKAAYKLEGAETALIVKANNARVKAEKGGHQRPAEEAVIGESSGSRAARYLDPKKRPTHRLKPIIGKKVDTIDWCRAELKRLIPEVDRLQAVHKVAEAKKLNSVFVEFNTLAEAQAAYQSLAHHQVLRMAPRFTGMTPGDVIWSNLGIRWWERVIRQFVTIAFVVALIIFWSFPVALVGFISNLQNLTNISAFSWLRFIYNLPNPLIGLITSLLPVVMLAVLMMLLPIVLRLAARLGGDPTKSAVELTVQNSYFGFQVVQVFLVATLASGAAAAVTKIVQDPSVAISLLSTNLPKASNFYLSWFVLQGLGVVSGVLLGLVGLILFMVLGKLLDKTPRNMYKRWVSLSGLGWGTVMPIYTNLFVIAICYAAIAPLVLGFAAIGLYLFYFAYRYHLLYVAAADIDTKGRIYPRALQQLFVGLYIAELCLIGLFAIGTGKSSGALGPLILMILMLVFTVLYQAALNSALSPLINYLPKSCDAEERHLLSLETGDPADGSGANGVDIADKEGGLAHPPPVNPNLASSAPPKQANFFTKWLRPDVYSDYATMRRLVPKDIAIHYRPEDEANAYFNPAISSPTPLLWIPRDSAGISEQEVRDTGAIIPITDQGAFLDDKNKVVWDAPDGRPPIYQEVPYY